MKGKRKNPFSAVRKNRLTFDGINIPAFVKNKKIPLYVSSEGAMSCHFDHLQKAFGEWGKKRVGVPYSIKDNFMPLILDTMNKKSTFFEIFLLGRQKAFSHVS